MKKHPKIQKLPDFELVDEIVKHSTSVLDSMHYLVNCDDLLLGEDASDYLISELLREMKGVENYVEEFCFRQQKSNKKLQRKTS